MKITFIGLGIMGSRMAANLLKNNVDVTVYNRSKGAVDSLALQGAQAAANTIDAVHDADVVFTMLSTPEVVKSVMMKKNGALHAMKENAIWSDCSTVNPSFSRDAKDAAQKKGIRFLDTPVAGTKPHAENAELVFFAGGEKSDLDIIEPLLNHMGTKVMHLGDTGMGTSFKMIVNMMLAQSMVTFSEAVIFGEKLGLDRDMLLDVMPNLVVCAPVTRFKSQMIKEGNYEANFPLEWMLKDLQLASITAYENDHPLYLANLAKELYVEANRSGMGRLDFGAIHKFLEER